MRVLVTGASGFVGRHLLAALRANGDEAIAAGTQHDGPPFAALDLLDAASARAVVDDAAPDAIVHLAGQAFVPQSVADPLGTLAVNATGTAHVLEAARLYRDRTHAALRVLVISSAEVYGIQPPANMPLDESAATQPANPYAASKLAAETYALAWSRSYGLDVCVARPFNHIGPGQDARFAVASFAQQLAGIAAGASRVMAVGNLEAERDFLDVRDVVRAYLALLANGRGGEVYNICSGRTVAIREVLRQLITIARVPVEVRDDPERMRPSDVPILSGNAAKLRAATGWEPAFTLAASLRDIYADAVERVAMVGA
jgi:GDP-4-dehydro-6-deoxy-D-mannose reductase